MSDEPRQPALPDDPADWPDDPYLVLGVTRGAAAADVRRAYTGLIRRFRPEQHPERFRRICEAYERLTATAPAAPFVADFQRRDLQSDVPPRRPRPARPSADAKPKRKSPRGHSLDDFWPLAERGDWPAAYQHLLTSDPRGRTSSRIAAALYWSLKLHPELDRTRRPIDWLLESILARGPRPLVDELYRQEQLATNEDPIGADLSRLLAAPLMRHQLFDMVVGRWQAADRRMRRAGDSRKARASLGRLIMADLEALRSANGQAQEPVWGNLLFHACQQLSWLNTRQTSRWRDVIFAELAELNQWHPWFEPQLIRLEFVQHLAADWWRARFTLPEFGRRRRVFKQVLTIARLAWRQPDDFTRPLLLELATDLRNRPSLIRVLDKLHKRAPHVLAQVAALFDELGGVSLPTPATITVATRLFRCRVGGNYSDYRRTLRDLCVRERLLPEQVADSIARYNDMQLPGGILLSQLIAADLPLSILCRAALRFWSV
jgi:hypothetical protein